MANNPAQTRDAPLGAAPCPPFVGRLDSNFIIRTSSSLVLASSPLLSPSSVGGADRQCASRYLAYAKHHAYGVHPGVHPTPGASHLTPGSMHTRRTGTYPAAVRHDSPPRPLMGTLQGDYVPPLWPSGPVRAYGSPGFMTPCTPCTPVTGRLVQHRQSSPRTAFPPPGPYLLTTPYLRTGLTFLHGWTVWSSVVVGSILSNNYYPTSLFSPPPCPCTFWGPLTTGGSGPTNLPLFGYIQTHNADLGASAILALSLTSSYAAHATLSQVPCPSRLGAPPRWTTFHLTAPARGATPGLRSPPPGRPGLVRAYGSLRVYDPRHFRVHSATCACLRPLPPIHRFDAARSAGPQSGTSLWTAVVARVDIGTSRDCGAWLRLVHTIQFGWGGSSIALPVLGFARQSSPTYLGDSTTPASTAVSSDIHLIPAGVPCPTGRDLLRQEMYTPHADVPFRAIRFIGGGATHLLHCKYEDVQPPDGTPSPPPDVPISPDGRATLPAGHCCTADQFDHNHIPRSALGMALCRISNLSFPPPTGFFLRRAHWRPGSPQWQVESMAICDDR